MIYKKRVGEKSVFEGLVEIVIESDEDAGYNSGGFAGFFRLDAPNGIVAGQFVKDSYDQRKSSKTRKTRWMRSELHASWRKN
jgi:hypothetical protein